MTLSMRKAAAPCPAHSLPRMRPAGLLRIVLLACGSAIVAVACGPLQQPEASGTPATPVTTAELPGRQPAAAPPATVVVPTVQAHKLALLLPLSGAQRAAGEAIRDGFLAAYLADPASDTRPEVLILDEASPGPAAAYQAALDAGAEALLGPLLKESVAEVAHIARPLPWLALNNLDTPAVASNPYQFALTPEDEARAIAARAAAQGQLRALALAPDSDWGRRLLGAFTAALEERGGTVVAYRFYDPAMRDYTAQIQRLLLLDESRNRQRELVANLGVSLEFEPRRRDDLDCIFLAANPVSGRLLWPQLRFLNAGDLPIYATSAIYQPGESGGVDREGIMFTDAPAIVGSDPRASALRATLASRWPAGATGQMRFYAMGYDAYALVRTMMAGGSPGLMPVDGLSGGLLLDGNRRIHRRMAWAAFRGGQVVPLEDAPPAAPADGPDPG